MADLVENNVKRLVENTKGLSIELQKTYRHTNLRMNLRKRVK